LLWIQNYESVFWFQKNQTMEDGVYFDDEIIQKKIEEEELHGKKKVLMLL